MHRTIAIVLCACALCAVGAYVLSADAPLHLTGGARWVAAAVTGVACAVTALVALRRP